MERRLRAVKAIALVVGAIVLLGAVIEISSWRRAPDHEGLRRLQAEITAAHRSESARSFDLRAYAPAATQQVCIVFEYTDIGARLAALLPEVAPSHLPIPPTRENEAALVFVAPGRAEAVFLDLMSASFVRLGRSCLPAALARIEVMPPQGDAEAPRLRFVDAAPP